MVFTDALDVDIGDSTRAVDHDTLADNPEWLRDKANQEHDFDISTGDGSHKDITFGTDSTFSIGATASHGLNLYVDAAYVGATASGTYAASPGALNIGGGTAAENLVFHLNDTAASADQKLGGIDFWGNDSPAGDQIRATIEAQYTGTGGIGRVVISGWNNATFEEYARFDSGGGAGDVQIAFATAGGNVGIGTASPASKLHVYANDAATTNAGITIEQDGTGDAMIDFLLTSAERWVIGVDNTDNFFKITDGTDLGGSDHFVIAATTGNVGIGTGSPSQLLEVEKDQNGLTNIEIDNNTSGTAAGSSLRVNSNAGGGTLYAFSSGYTTSNQYIADSMLLESSASNSGGLALSSGHATADLSFWTNSTQRVTIDGATGNVGIGTTSPNVTLEIADDGATNSIMTYEILRVGSDSGNSNGVNIGGNGTDAMIGPGINDTKLHLLSRTGGTYTSKLSVTTAGVAIGSSTTPETDLMVENDLWIGGDDANANRSGGENAAGNNLAIQNTTTTSVFFRAKDSGVTGYTTIDSGADDIFAMAKNNTGGGVVQYLIGGDTADATMNEILAMGGTASTTHTTAGRALFEISVFEISSGSTAAITADGNVFGIRDAGGTLLLLDEDGNMWTDDTITTMDFEAPGVERDDVALISAMDYLGNPAGVIQSEWEDFTRYNETDLVLAGVRGDTIANGGMLNHTKMLQLHNGGIRQLERKKADRTELDAERIERARLQERLELAEATAVDQQELLLEAHEIIDRLSKQLKAGNE